MSFYGNIKRTNSSPFIFDKYYPNRKAMNDALKQPKGDGIYIGRYVLVKYTCKYVTDGNGNTYLDYFDKYIEEDGTEEKIINPLYEDNAEIDIREFGDTYNGTVWQKICTNITNDDEPNEKYILVAELNAAVPRIVFEATSPKEVDAGGEESWVEPRINPVESSEDSFKITMPNPLHLEVEQMIDPDTGLPKDFYGAELIKNPALKKTLSFNDISEAPSDYDIQNEPNWEDLSDSEKKHRLALSSDYNKMKWENYYINKETGEETPTETPGFIDIKRLSTQFYAFGQMISDIYDIMYGAPENGKEGLRPFYTDNSLAELLSNYDKGLIGILTSIATDAKGDASQDMYGRTLQPGLHYYFVSKWCDASEDTESFIENIPNVIGSSTGSSAESQYYIDFNDNNGDYIKRHIG